MANLHAFGDKIMGGGSTGGGHTIWNRIKAALTQRSKLWFKDATVSDVSADGASAVEVITSVSESDFDNLPTDGTADGIYEINSSNVAPLMADNIGYGSGTVADALDGLEYSSMTITSSTVDSDIRSLISASIAKGRIPYIICEYSVSGTTFHNTLLKYTHSGFGTTEHLAFTTSGNDTSAVYSVVVMATGTTAAQTGHSVSNMTLWY